MMLPLNLASGSAGIQVRVQPVVLLNICDAFTRRNEGQRVIGTLLGSVGEGIVDVKNSYAVPHTENSESVAVDITHHKTLYELHRRVNPKEVIVGWYSTGLGVSGGDSLIQDFYTQECQNPVHLTVDTTLSGDKCSIHAYVARKLSLGDRQQSIATEFQEVPSEVRMLELEKIGVELLDHEVTEKLPSNAELLPSSFVRLEQLLDRAAKYCADVSNGKIKGDPAIGRYLSDTVSGVPFISKGDMEKLFTETSQDVMLIRFLSGLVRSQISLADKLGTTSLPLT